MSHHPRITTVVARVRARPRPWTALALRLMRGKIRTTLARLLADMGLGPAEVIPFPSVRRRPAATPLTLAFRSRTAKANRQPPPGRAKDRNRDQH